MKKKEIVHLIKSNDTDKLNLYITELLDKSKILDRQINLTSIGMVILALLFYLGNLNVVTEIQLGPLKVGDVTILSFILPLTFSFLILRYIILNAHKAEIKDVISVFAKEYFDYDNSKIGGLETDDFTRLILPISMYDEIGKLAYKSRNGCLSVLFPLPILAIVFAPYILVTSWLYPQVMKFSSIDISNKLLLITTIWILLFSVFYVVKTMVIGYNREDG